MLDCISLTCLGHAGACKIMLSVLHKYSDEYGGVCLHDILQFGEDIFIFDTIVHLTATYVLYDSMMIENVLTVVSFISFCKPCRGINITMFVYNLKGFNQHVI